MPEFLCFCHVQSFLLHKAYEVKLYEVENCENGKPDIYSPHHVVIC